MPFLSVVIPTYNRAAILEKTLQALAAQHAPKDIFEVIVVNDGSTDETDAVVARHKKVWGERLTLLTQPNQGQGVARNHGIAKAQGKVTLFLGDDMIPAKDVIGRHSAFHTANPQENRALLGHTDWHPDLPKTPFGAWLTNGSSVLGKYGGHQFAYEKLAGKTEADFWFFYTAHISLKTALLRQFPFDADFSGYGWEDIELGYRLTKEAHLDLRYDKDAKVFHDHILDESSLQKRMRAIGQSAHLLQQKHPELNRVPPAWKRGIFRLLASQQSLKLLKRKKNPTLYYYALSKKYFLEGLKSPILQK